MGRYYKEMEIKDLVVVCTDVGGVKMANAYARMLKGGPRDRRKDAAWTRARPSAGNVIGDVKNQNILIIDDMIATGGSIAEACRVLERAGARLIYMSALRMRL